ncbi:MAG: redox-sensing transcriptional repressor Rex [Christensenellaceae bacterium]|nr:redox-sensing transcriptional repressor Rex [Christensenellaceae bacterium]
MEEMRIPEAVIRRLPKYYRYLVGLERRGEIRISSSAMSRDMGLNASQIRRDLNCFGGFGQQGYGYNVSKLKGEIARILGLSGDYRMFIVGAGNIGQALAGYGGFAREGFCPAAIFDVDPAVIGTKVGGLVVRPLEQLEETAKNGGADVGVICTPASAAQQVADRLVALGVRDIWNFAPFDVQVPESVSVENVHLNDSLFVLSYRLNAGEQ